MDQKTSLDLLEKKLGLKFKNKQLLLNALVHRSYLNEHKNFFLPSNEKMEFLGDSLISLACSLYLFSHYSHLDEGEYTDIKAASVRAETLAEIAKSLGLGKHIFLSKGQIKENGRNNVNILADTFEALICAIFLDSNFEHVYSFLKKHLFERYVDNIIKKRLYLSPKTVFQEFTQKKYKQNPFYQLIEEKGPSHRKIFKVGLFLDGRKISEGVGYSKKEAEEKAAKIALEIFRIV